MHSKLSCHQLNPQADVILDAVLWPHICHRKGIFYLIIIIYGHYYLFNKSNICFTRLNLPFSDSLNRWYFQMGIIRSVQVRTQFLSGLPTMPLLWWLDVYDHHRTMPDCSAIQPFGHWGYAKFQFSGHFIYHLSNLSKFNNLSYLHFSLCAPMSSAALIHLSFLLAFFLFSFVVCCVHWDVTCRNRKAFLCIYSTLQGYQVRIKPYPLFSGHRQQNSSSLCCNIDHKPVDFHAPFMLSALHWSPRSAGLLALCFTWMLLLWSLNTRTKVW